MAEALDLCLSCKGCSTDCPAGVDMATYKAEALHQRYRGKLRPASHYALGWLPRWAALTSRARWTASLANAALRFAPAAALAKRLGGIDERRDLPVFATQSFRRWFAERQESTRPASRPATTDGSESTPVLLWVDTFTNAFAPQVGQAAVAVLEAAGYQVRVTERNVCCGLTWISTGQLDGARRQLKRTLDELGPALDAGIPVVGLEPSCTAALRADAAELLPDDPRAEALGGRREDPGRAAHRAPTAGPRPTCPTSPGSPSRTATSTRSSAGTPTGSCSQPRGRTITAVGGCCGLAGNFGVERGHYDVSVAVAETALLPAVREAVSQAESSTAPAILADGFSCRTQLDQLADVHGIHLAELLAERLRQET